MSTAAETEDVGPRPDSPFWLTVTLAIIFGLFYAYDAWEAVGNLVGMTGLAGQLATTLSATGWVVLLLGILLPIALFAGAFILGRKRGPLQQAALYVVGLGISAVLTLDVLALFGPGNLLA